MDDGGSVFNETVINIELDDDTVDLDLTDYDEEEIMHINEVMQKDKTLRFDERQRKKKIEDSLDQSIMSIEMNNVDSGDKFCLVCGGKFLILVNPRSVCVICERGVCNSCLYKLNTSGTSICQLCYLNCTREGKTGKWFSSLSKNNGRFRRSATLIIMNSIRRIKAKFNSTPEPVIELPSTQRPPSIKDPRNGDIPAPMYLTKKNSPKPPRRTYIDIEVPVAKAVETVPDIEISIDTTDHREMEVVSNHDEHIDIPTVSNDLLDTHDNHHSNLSGMASMSTSMMSIYSESPESYNTGLPVSGDVLFSVSYNSKIKCLEIFVDECRNITVADRKKGRTDPYMKAYLLPDRTKTSKRKTGVKSKTINPVFKETLTYFIDPSDISSRTLSLAVWHKSSLIKYNIFLGEVQLVLADVDLKNKECSWHSLHEKRKYPLRSAGFLFKGEIMFAMKYIPSSRRDSKGTLHVHITRAKKLDTDRVTVNSFVKGYLLPKKDAKSKQKTSVFRHSLNPAWNCLFQFPDVSPEDLKDRSLELSVYHQNRIKVNEFLGGVRLNLGLGLHSSEHVQWMDAQGAEKEAWERFLGNPTQSNEVTLNLRPNLDY